MGYLNRDHVARILGVSRRRSFDIIPSDTTLGLVSTKAFAKLLNASRIGDAPVVHDLPDIIGIAEAAGLVGVSTRRLRNWTIRVADRCPCWRISGKTILFERASLSRWLESHGMDPLPEGVTPGESMRNPVPTKLKGTVKWTTTH